MDSTDAEFLRYFDELRVECDAWTSRLEARLLAGESARGSPDLFVEPPRWAFDDPLCFTTVTEEQARDVLPPLFDAVRRHHRLHVAATRDGGAPGATAPRSRRSASTRSFTPTCR